MEKYTINDIAKLHEEKFNIKIDPSTISYWRDKWELEPRYHWKN